MKVNVKGKQARYLYAERCCSYWIPCKVLAYNVDEPLELQYMVDRLYNIPLRKGGAIIEYIDEFGEEVTAWVELDWLDIGEEGV